MADLPLFWQVVVTLLIIIGLVYLLALGVGVYGAKDEHEHDVVWDDDLEEGSAPVPSWWFWSGIATAFFAVMYMVFYPSFGNYNGLFNLTNAKRYSESLADIDDQYYKKLTTLSALGIQDLQTTTQAMRIAGNLYAQNCAVCHGKDATGQGVFPNLKDKEWLWGNKTEQITQTISEGRKGIMPPMGLVLSDLGVEQVAHYIKSVGDGTFDEKTHLAGKEKYQQFCTACHGRDLEGNVIFGTPNLSDDSWIYGGSLAAIKASITSGRQGVMPAHKNRLSKLQIKLLTAWLKRQ